MKLTEYIDLQVFKKYKINRNDFSKAVRVITGYGSINPAAYKHFLLLHSAIWVLISSSLSEDLDFAHIALSIFVNRAEDIYGPEFLSYVIAFYIS